MIASRRILLLVALAALVPGRAAAGGFSNPDFGVRRLGMFAVLGNPDDVTAIFHNPAGLVLGKGTRLYHAQSWFFMDLAFRMYDSDGKLRPDHELEPDWNIGTIPFFGVASDLGTERFRGGLAIYAPNAYGSALPEDEPTRYHATRVLFLASRATLTGAYEFDETFAVGANVSLIHVYLQAERIMNGGVLGDPDYKFEPVEKTSAGDKKLELDGQDWTWAVDIAALFRPIPELRLGVVFAGGSDVELEGCVKLTDSEGNADCASHRTQTVIPYTLKAGVNWEFAPDFEVGFDFRYWHYQVLQMQRSVLSSPIAGQTELADPKNYGNSWNWCLGLYHRVTPTFEVMMGYQQDFTPIPEQTFTLDNPSRDQHGVGLGARWQASDKVRLGLAMVRNWFDLVDVQESRSVPPTNLKGHGGALEIGFDVEWQL